MHRPALNDPFEASLCFERRSANTKIRIFLGALLTSLGFLAGAADAQLITEFSAGITGAASDITAGPDGNLWFTEPVSNRIGRITPSGIVTEFSAGISPGSGLAAITTGPDGNLWFTESNTRRIGRITPGGVVTEFSEGISARPAWITTGPDGNLWFTESAGQIGQIAPAGVVTEFIASTSRLWVLGPITAGPDGNLWFTESTAQCFRSVDLCASSIGRITPQGIVSHFPLGFTLFGLGGITAGPDGNLWFMESNFTGGIGRITPGGVITHFGNGIAPSTRSAGITVGPDGRLWFTESAGRIGRIALDGVIVEFNAGITAGSHPARITVGSDGNVWFTESSANQIGRITACLNASACSPSTTTVGSSVNPSKVGQAIVLTAAVAGNFPTGTVQFMDGATNLGPAVPLSGGGIAQLLISTLTQGAHAITAVYSGDANNAPCASIVLIQKVGKVRHRRGG
jgi:streptogramin lyase